MINDALEEVDVIQNIKEDSQTIKIRCRNCKVLNDENARYCNHCGKEL
jgi:rRNA maturation endonuclease Nob1